MLSNLSIAVETFPQNRNHDTTAEWLFDRWRGMLRIRRAEEAIGTLVENGEARCPCHLYIGQEIGRAHV